MATSRYIVYYNSLSIYLLSPCVLKPSFLCVLLKPSPLLVSYVATKQTWDMLPVLSRFPVCLACLIFCASLVLSGSCCFLVTGGHALPFFSSLVENRDLGLRRDQTWRALSVSRTHQATGRSAR